MQFSAALAVLFVTSLLFHASRAQQGFPVNARDARALRELAKDACSAHLFGLDCDAPCGWTHGRKHRVSSVVVPDSMLLEPSSMVCVLQLCYLDCCFFHSGFFAGVASLLLFRCLHLGCCVPLFRCCSSYVSRYSSMRHILLLRRALF